MRMVSNYQWKRRKLSVPYKKLLENEYRRKLESCYFWGAVNTLYLILIFFDIIFRSVIYSKLLHFIQVILGVLAIINTCYFILKIFWLQMKIRKIKGLMKQIKIYSKKTIEPTSVLDNSSDFICYQRTFMEVVQGEKRVDRRDIRNYSRFEDSTFSNITNEPMYTMNDLATYLKELDKDEKSLSVLSGNDSNGYLNPHWINETLTPLHVPIVLRRTIYQTSPVTQDYGHNNREEGGSPVLQINTEFWRRHRVNPLKLVNWTSNLRMWISKSILKPLLNEIIKVDNSLKTQGITNVCIGKVAIENLYNTANNFAVVEKIPSLPFIIPFLQVSPHQQYVLQRIKALAVGSSMSEFKWKSGGRYEDKEWEPHLPTDAELIMHLFCTYLDCQLPMLPSDPTVGPFSTKYFCKAPLKPRQTKMVICQQSNNPPKYQLILDDEVQDIPQGRNNLFYTILLFIYYIQSYHKGLLERINLGKSGINMLWIIERSP